MKNNEKITSIKQLVYRIKYYFYRLFKRPCLGLTHKVVMTNTEFVKKLDNLVNRGNYYYNSFPRNLCYYDGSRISADCWNLVKSLIWDPTIDQNYTNGRYAYPDFSTGLGDWTVGGMIDACYKADPTSVSSDFSNLNAIPAGSLLYYSDGGHAGVYVGNGKVIECTPIWDNGIQYTDINTSGLRSKNGQGGGYWTKWARMPWIKYEEQPTPSHKQWKKGDKVTLAKGSKIYGGSGYFASWVYETVLTVSEDSYGDRAVIKTDDNPCVGACYTDDLTAYNPVRDSWKKGEKVSLKAGSFIYGTTNYYADWVYQAPLIVYEDSCGDRAVIGTSDNPIIGPVHCRDLIAR